MPEEGAGDQESFAGEPFWADQKDHDGNRVQDIRGGADRHKQEGGDRDGGTPVLWLAGRTVHACEYVCEPFGQGILWQEDSHEEAANPEGGRISVQKLYEGDQPGGYGVSGGFKPRVFLQTV